MPAEPLRPGPGSAPESDPASATHLTADELYDWLENRVGRKRAGEIEAHVAECPECAASLAIVAKSQRPASREEQAELARIPERTDDQLLAALEPHVADTAPDRRSTTTNWRALVVALVLIGAAAAAGLWIRERLWLPASTRRAAVSTLEGIVELRQGTGRIPLRYLNELDRAGVTRSSFDDTTSQEQALLAGLRAAVERSPDPEAELVLGLLMLDDGDLVEAERLLSGVREAQPDSVDAINGLAVLYYEKARRADPSEAYGLHQKGLALLREAERFDNEDLRVLFNYGRFYEALGMGGAASKAFQRYLTHDPNSQWAEQAALALQP